MASSQGRGMAVKVLMMVAMVLLWVNHSYAAVYTVGDRTSWTISSLNYNSWASSKHIRMNDVLRFTYSSELHNVVLVSKADYDQCTSTRPLVVYSNGNTLVRLTRKGTYYFICGVPGHCEAGMKMQVTVL